MKRNGSEAAFDREKIAAAVTKANLATDQPPELSGGQVAQLALSVEQTAARMGRTLSVEEIQELVETEIMRLGAFETAKRYIRYRYVRSLARAANTTDSQILTLIECNNEEAKQENANKNPVVNSVQRDYMAGEVSKDITQRLLLPPDIVEAHKAGIIHFHDMDYYAQHMHNCDLVNLEDMLQNGTVISVPSSKSPTAFPPPATSPPRSSPRWPPTSTAASPSPWPTWPPSSRSPGRRSAGRCWRRSPPWAAPPRRRCSPASWRSACGRRSAGGCRPSSTRWSPS